MGNKLKTTSGVLIGIIGFIASVTGIAGWLGFALHFGDVLYVPNPIIIITAIFIALMLFFGFLRLGGIYGSESDYNYIDRFVYPGKYTRWQLNISEHVRLLIKSIRDERETLRSALIGFIGFVASVTGIASWLGFTLHLGDIYVPDLIIIVVAIFITLLLTLGSFYFGFYRAASRSWEFFLHNISVTALIRHLLNIFGGLGIEWQKMNLDKKKEQRLTDTIRDSLKTEEQKQLRSFKKRMHKNNRKSKAKNPKKPYHK